MCVYACILIFSTCIVYYLYREKSRSECVLRIEAQELCKRNGCGGINVGIDLVAFVFSVCFKQFQSFGTHGTLKSQDSPLGLVLQGNRVLCKVM